MPNLRAVSRIKLSPAFVAWATLCALFFALITSHVLYEVYLDCHLYYDLGIYTEGIRQLGLHNLNPYLSARHIHLFADHFDPMVWLAAPWAHVIAAPYGLVLFESLFLCLGVAPLFYLQHKKQLCARNAFIFSLLILFNLGTITAAHYPIHPTTWALAPWVWLVVALDCRRYGWALASFVALLMCKEEFPFIAPMLAALLWQRRERRWAITFAAVGVVWLLGVYVVRPYMLGPVESYWSAPLDGIGSGKGLYTYFYKRLTDNKLCEFGPLMLLPIVWLGALLWHTNKALPAWGYLGLALPPLALRFLTMRWGHQYHAVTEAACLMAFLPAMRRARLPGYVWPTTIAILLATNYVSVRGMYGLASRGRDHRFTYCSTDAKRRASLNRARALLDNIPDGRLLAQMNLLTKLTHRRDTYKIDMPKNMPCRPYHLVFFEKPPNGCAWPSSDKVTNQLIDKWRAQSDTLVLVDDAYVFLASGTFYES